jgi:hypothetical protein
MQGTYEIQSPTGVFKKDFDHDPTDADIQAALKEHADQVAAQSQTKTTSTAPPTTPPPTTASITATQPSWLSRTVNEAINPSPNDTVLRALNDAPTGPFGLSMNQIFDYIKSGPGNLKKALDDLQAGNYARGGHEAIVGAGVTASPFMGGSLMPAETILGNLIKTGGPILAGVGGKALVGKMATDYGATPDQAALAGDIGALGAGGFTRLASNLAEVLSAAKGHPEFLAKMSAHGVGILNPRAGRVADAIRDANEMAAAMRSQAAAAAAGAATPPIATPGPTGPTISATPSATAAQSAVPPTGPTPTTVAGSPAMPAPLAPPMPGPPPATAIPGGAQTDPQVVSAQPTIAATTAAQEALDRQTLLKLLASLSADEQAKVIDWNARKVPAAVILSRLNSLKPLTERFTSEPAIPEFGTTRR